VKSLCKSLCCVFLALGTASIAVAQERTLEQVKAEVLRRTTDNNPPFDRLNKAEVESILATLTSLEPNQWGEKWCKAGLAHEAKGDELLKRARPPRKWARSTTSPTAIATWAVIP